MNAAAGILILTTDLDTGVTGQRRRAAEEGPASCVSEQAMVCVAHLGARSVCGLDNPSDNVKPREQWLRQERVSPVSRGSGSRTPSETQSLALLYRPDHAHVSLAVTGWLPCFQNVHPLSGQKEEERAKRLLSVLGPGL